MIAKRDESERDGHLGSADLVIIEERSSHSDQPIKRYSKGKLLGKGGFAKCYEFTSLDTKRVYAAKVIEKSSLSRTKAKEKLTSEIKIHRSLKNPYIVNFEHFFQDAECVYILLQVCPNQTLNELIKRRKRLTQVEAQCYLYQISLALKYMQTNKVIHRDLKLGNLFLSDKLEIKIGDFGLAARLESDHERRKTMCGTPNYIAPEILDNRNGHSYEVDVWSLGVIAYALLVGRPPFETTDVKLTYNKIRMCNYTFPDSIQISKTAKNFISKMLQLQPARRLTVDQILGHEFFTINPFPKSLPISCLACPPNANFMKKFQPAKQQKQNLKRLDSVDKMNTSRGYDMANTDRVQSLHIDKFVSTRASTDYLAMVGGTQNQQPPQRAASSTALVGHKYITKKQSQEQPFDNKGPEIWVSHHCFDPKFGVCYLLNSNATGMHFNDDTIMISNCLFNRIRYLEDRGSFDVIEDIPNNNKDLVKKMKIISHFNSRLRNQRDSEQNKMNNQQRFKAQKLKYKRQTADNAMTVYVKKHMKLPNRGSLFIFSNKDIQFIFEDSTEILLKNQNVVYVNKYSQRKNFAANSPPEVLGEEVLKRLRYVIETTRKINTGQRRTSTSREHNDQNRRPISNASKRGTSIRHSKLPAGQQTERRH